MRFFAAAAGVIAVASAYTFPTPFENPAASGAAPSGNPLTLPSTTNPVTLGQSFDITWNPTSAGPVALVLCKGPSTDCEPTLTIAEKIPNSGKFAWVPFGLTPSADSSSGYGIMLVDYSDKSYQYTTQFGVLAGSKPKPSGPSSPSGSVIPIPSSTVVIPVTATTTWCPEGGATPPPTWTTSVGTTGLPSPSTIPTTGPAPPQFTNGADHNMASFGAIGAIAGVAALLAF
ncbi:uncharacterized protein TRUGW13939_00596 [Talaromyces rugulosus]|uniref:Yeast cell wall synthesis Kre9/Knh1-like N-terminal domain-containing protein n=1 Tax=Talaromyces rugulosus TaxID=121627 RepID=A0A7H8QHR4_TALRU|nr:uncharacterized protein TRUGW13939_00596 [Talaromyces rugulosus]QKX53517.1 hypothetical protein TRUGW13939_00596 [Talaromyces rugulosus]